MKHAKIQIRVIDKKMVHIPVEEYRELVERSTCLREIEVASRYPGLASYQVEDVVNVILASIGNNMKLEDTEEEQTECCGEPQEEADNA